MCSVVTGAKGHRLSARLRFIHTADIHLGAPFKRVGAEDGEVRDRLLSASATAFARVVDAAVEHDVDFVVLAGDALDGSEQRPAAQLLFQHEMERLAERGIPVYAVRGNHDPEEGYNAGLRLPRNVRYFGTGAVERIVHERDGVPVCSLYGRSYPIRQVTENYAAAYERHPADVFSIGVLHTNVGGREGWEPYAPAALQDLRAAGMDYWALGHIHAFEVLAEDPPTIYAGSPQGIDPAETGAHGCVLVSVEDGSPVAEFIETAAIRWESVAADVSDAEGIDGVCTRLISTMEDLSAESGNAGVIARVRLEGRSAAHATLSGAAAREDLLAHVREIGAELAPWVWIDRLTDATSATVDVEAIAEGEGFLGDLVRNAEALDPDQAVADVIDELRSHLTVCPALELSPTEIVARARDACLDLLIDEEGSA